MAVDIQAALTRKIGPLPAWVYVVLIGGGAWAVYYWRKLHSAKGTATTETTGSSLTQADGSSYDFSSSLPGAYGVNDNMSGVGAGGSTGGTTTVPDASVPTTNPQWFSLASNYLQGFGYDAASVSQALNNFLLGLQASAQDRALFNLAVSRYGQPPEGIPPQPTAPPPQPPGLPGGGGTGSGGTQPPGNPAPPPQPAPQPPVTHEYYTVVHGDTLFGIARRFNISEPQLYEQNKDVIEAAAHHYGHASSNNGNLIFGGTKLLIR